MRWALLLLLAALLVPAPAGASCLGAAARDPKRACDPPPGVTPSPDEALLQPASPCAPLRRRPLDVCTFGVPRGRSSRTVALIGDSHAVHWRAALDVVLRRRGWHGLSITRSRCPFALSRTRGCGRWPRDVLRYLRRRLDVRTVVVSGNATAGVVIPRGSTYVDTKIAGFTAAWARLPARIDDVLVIHDVPRAAPWTMTCVRHALTRRFDPAARCARPRRVALPVDLAVTAAARDGDPRTRSKDFSDLMCDATRCPPVIGGALVIKDIGHITQTFSRSVGPYLAPALPPR